MQHEITERGKLLDQNGNLREPGWARRLLLTYDRDDIKVGKMHIKEWDYYYIGDDHRGIALTVADNGYMGLISASILDFDAAQEITVSEMEAFPMGKYRMPATSGSGNVGFENKRVTMRFTKATESRELYCKFGKFKGEETLEVKIHLDQPPMDSMVIATPFDKPKHFYYNQKINCMRATGGYKLGGEEYTLEQGAMSTLDWGRGVWTYDNTWYWGNGNGWVDGKPFGFNIGYGFGNTSAASENMLFYDDVAHKLEQVTFNIPEGSYTEPWTFTSSDGRFEMDFVPIIDRASRTNALLIESDQHQVFGKFTGKAVLDDGRELMLKDFVGFAEKVRNRY